MTLFLLIGSLGLAALLASLVLGDILGDHFEALDAGGLFSGPVIGAFFAAFGFGSALILNSTNASTGVSALGGLGAGVVVGGISAVITRSVMNMATDATLNSADLVGSTATVVTRIPDGGMGEVSLTYNGQMLKLGARSPQAVAGGQVVTITAVTSSSSVVVAPASSTPDSTIATAPTKE